MPPRRIHMLINRYRYAVEFYDENNISKGRAPLQVDWVPAVECAWLRGLRRNLLSSTDGTDGTAIQPIWQNAIGEPYVAGFRVSVPSEDAEGISAEFSSEYFNDSARAATAPLVEEGDVRPGEHLLYRIMAFADPDHAGPSMKSRFRTETLINPLPIRQSRLSDLMGISLEAGPTTPGDMPVLIRASVLEETVELSRKAGSLECGGILIGHLHRDPEMADVFAEITTQVPARHTVADTNKLTFTHDTWTAAQAAIDLRGRNELLLGWWHCHPVHAWCKNCPPEKRGVCPLAHGFLSIDDCRLHRTVFPRAYTLALLISHISESNLPHSLYGWRGGRLECRGYHRLDDVQATAETVAVPTASNPPRRKPRAAKRGLRGSISHETTHKKSGKPVRKGRRDRNAKKR
jgi:hypothetical protein